MSTLSLRPDDRGGLGPTERWSSSGIGNWENHHHHQVVNVLEPTPSFLYSSQSQSIFPTHLMHDVASMQALKMDALENISNYNLETCNSSSMVESCTSNEDVCTAAPEISPVVTSLVDCTRSASRAALGDWNLRMHQTGRLSPCQVSADGLVQGLKRRLEAVGGGPEQIRSHRKMWQHHQEAQTTLQDNYGGYVGNSPWRSSGTVPVMKAPLSPENINSCESWSGAGTDMDSIRAIVFCHASQPVPSVEEMASSRPQRRNVRISKDPQSVAARHRRDRISDRMRVLQRLVPGGTKMDTASMLDEAIHYVKFLELQVQTLEQIGSNSASSYCTDDAQVAGSFAQAHEVHHGHRRPFDWSNGAANFQLWALNNSNVDNVNISGRTATAPIEAPPRAGRSTSNHWT